ncbi:DUF2064 domain-containing protein [Halosimplex aquaticum]|uniref:DUF2064 domain-containing protein n=1 Tax=Halosimplex aquaticum TaxID=3026162 RepID=A0ABD5YA79_9EURY|nr:DUF2064 domain-containing protein [Halosimplex aquaticum]
MTTVAVFVRPPEPGTVLESCVDTGAVTAAEAADLYAAMVRDVCAAVEASGGELLVNYRPVNADDPTGPVEDDESLAAVRDVVDEALSDPGSARYEVQVGTSFSARAGNTVTHLLEREEVKSAAVVRPTAALLERRHVDSAAMKLRQSEVVLAPATDGGVAYAGFTDPIDFEDAFAPPEVETVTDRACDGGLDVDFIEMVPVAESPSGFATLLSHIRARQRAGLRIPPRTSAVLDDLGLRAEAVDDSLAVGRD